MSNFSRYEKNRKVTVTRLFTKLIFKIIFHVHRQRMGEKLIIVSVFTFPVDLKIHI